MKYNDKQKEYIRNNYLKLSKKQISKDIKGSYSGVDGFMKKEKLIVPEHIKNERIKSSQFKKGHKPFNKGLKLDDYASPENIDRIKKTQFKKGHKPHNTKYDGHEVLSKDGYIYMRISEGNYRLKHLYLWEKKNGALPKSHCLWCLDGNIKNTDISNWELITRRENLRRNVHDVPPELMRAKKLTTRIIKKLKKHE